MSDSSRQRHQHGVKKNLVEGIGGVLVGAALVLLMRGMIKARNVDKAAAGQNGSTTPAISGDSA